MAKRGLGDKQVSDNKRAKEKILIALEKGQFLRYGEIQEKTGLSTATLSKHLKELEKGIVERWVDKASKEYPIPVYYRLKISKIEWRERLLKIIENISDKQGLDEAVKNLTSTMTMTALENLSWYFQTGKNEGSYQQYLDYFVLSFYSEAISMLKQKLTELSNQGVDVPVLLSSIIYGKQDKEV